MFSDFVVNDDKHRISKKLKTCSYGYLEHKIKNEYGGSLVMCVNNDDKEPPSAASTSGEVPGTSSSTSLIQDAGKEADKPELEYGTDANLSDNADLDISDLDELLEENLPESYKGVSESVHEKLKAKRSEKDQDFKELHKVVMDEYNTGCFDVLPEGWIKVIHDTGIPMYANRTTRVVTFSRPYFLGAADLENHRIPTSAIPCLAYRKKTEEMSLNGDILTKTIRNLKVPVIKVETAEENQMAQSLSPQEVYDYCKDKLPFKTIMVPQKKPSPSTSSDPSSYLCPGLPVGTIVISFPIVDKDGKGNVIRRREWMINPAGKSYISVLHEFLQQGLKMQPVYIYRELEQNQPMMSGTEKRAGDDGKKSRMENKCQLFESTVLLNGEEFGKGTGNSKRVAKLEAAKDALETLMPELKGVLDKICKNGRAPHPDLPVNEKNIFDDMNITDPRVAELSVKTAEPSPYSILLTCLKRNYGTCKVMFKYTVSKKHNKNNHYTLLLGKHLVTVPCKNKRDGKQRTAQAMLQALHPQLKTWGSIIRLYGSRSAKKAYEKKAEEQEITQLQYKAKLNEPNCAILDKLDRELNELHKKMKPIESIDEFVKEDVPNMSGIQLSSLDYEEGDELEAALDPSFQVKG